MNTGHLDQLNLSLFRMLDALLAERSVTRAAAQLGVTQSAVSHGLARLRRILGDPLLVRGRDAMLPTPRAEALRPALRLGLAELQRVLEAAPAFDPAGSTRRFSLATVDHPLLTGLPRLVERLRRAAPGVDLRLRPLGPGLAEDLARGTLDGVLAGGEVEQAFALERGLMRSRIVAEPFVCLLRRGHPALAAPFDLAAYLALPHLLVSTGGGERGMVDRQLERRGRVRRIAATVAHFVGAPSLVAASDLVATVPAGIAGFAQAGGFAVETRPPPLRLPLAEAYLWWHQRSQHDPGHAWWRAELLRAFAAFRHGRQADATAVP